MGKLSKGKNRNTVIRFPLSPGHIAVHTSHQAQLTVLKTRALREYSAQSMTSGARARGTAPAAEKQPKDFEVSGR